MKEEVFEFRFYEPFLDSFFEQIKKVGLAVAGLSLDHIAYQASSAADYEHILPEFSTLGELVGEEIIAERRVSVFDLHEPMKYKNYEIPALELIEPKVGQHCASEFQHAEFVIDQPFEEYMKKYPTLNWDTSSMYRDEFSHLKLHFENGLTLKFLLRPILELMKEKK